jgi:predicted acylesterase/phospholipase RssA
VGGGCSIATVGIPEALAAEGIRPDQNVGCSSGPMFGATLAPGLSSRWPLPRRCDRPT